MRPSRSSIRCGSSRRQRHDLREGVPFPTMLVRLLIAASLVACGPDSKPAGTIADPVEICEKSAQVCRISPGVLGVCTPDQSPAGFRCAPQH